VQFAMACCWSRGAERLLPPSRDSPFDRMLLDGVARAEQAGVFRSSPSAVQRRCLSGTLGLVVQFSPVHYGKKRSPTTSPQRVADTTVDPAAFNFTKVNPVEKIAEVEVAAGRPQAVTVLANISPLALGHTLLIPSYDQVLPQVLTEEHFLTGLHLLAKSSRHDFRLVFNSMLAYASVNHFHWHGMYLNHCGFPDARLPVEKVDRSVIAGAITEGRVSAELLVESQWYVRGFVISAGCRQGAEGDRPPADLEALASIAQLVVAELHRRNIPHNVILAPPSERRRKQVASTGMAHEEVAKPNSLSPDIYILPRQVESAMREDACFHSGVMEVSGLLIAQTEESYEAFTEESLKEVFRSDVCLPETEFDDLICKVAWLIG